MRILEKSLLIVCLVAITKGNTRIPRPNGVSLQHASLYRAGQDGSWHCLDGKQKIKFAQVNDDYCDCADGSDEPGTSACPNGVFHCENAGYIAQDISSSRVNDGVCDCCDGSDEAGNKCANICEELGRIEQEKRRSTAELHKRGAVKRTEMINKGQELKQEREKRRQELERQKQEQEVLKAEKEELKQRAEAAEKEAVDDWKRQQQENESLHKMEAESLANSEEAKQIFLHYDRNQNGLIEITELQVDLNLDRDNNGVVTVEEARFYLDERDNLDYNNFLAIAWPRIKSQHMLAQGIFKPPTENPENEEGELVEGTEQEHSERDHNEGLDGEHEQEHDQEHEHEDEEHEEEHEEEEGEVHVQEEYDPETQRLVEEANAARSAFNDVDRSIRDIDQELREINDSELKDYGPHQEFAVLDGSCFTYEDREYVYTLCPFDRASQKQRSGHSETTLGRWESWLNPERKQYAQQKYSHGASCWNGPQRSTVVELRCGMEDRVTNVYEPNRCEYVFEFETPAACHEVPDANMHDEL